MSEYVSSSIQVLNTPVSNVLDSLLCAVIDVCAAFRQAESETCLEQKDSKTALTAMPGTSMVCPVCQCTHSNQASVVRCMKQHKKPLRCYLPSCQALFFSEKSRSHHFSISHCTTETKHPDKCVECAWCKQWFKAHEGDLERHMISTHFKSLLPEFRCAHCTGPSPVTFSYAADLAKHMLLHVCVDVAIDSNFITVGNHKLTSAQLGRAIQSGYLDNSMKYAK